MRTFKSIAFVALAIGLANCTKIEGDKGPIPPVFHEASQCPTNADIADLEIQQNDNGILIIRDTPKEDLLIDGEEHTVYDSNNEKPKIYRGGCRDKGFEILYRDGSKDGVITLTKTEKEYVLTNILDGQAVDQPKQFQFKKAE